MLFLQYLYILFCVFYILLILDVVVSIAAIAVEIMIIYSLYFNRVPIGEFVRDKYIYLIVFATLETISWKVLTPKLEHIKENRTAEKERNMAKVLIKATHLLYYFIILISIILVILLKLQTE